MVIAGALIVLLGAFGLIIPFVGPLFDFGMGPEPAWVLTTSRLVRHVIPGVAVILGGLMLLPPRGGRASRWLGTALAFLGGAWLTVAPVVLGPVSGGPIALTDVLRPLAYHYGTGLLVTALAAFALGRMSGLRASKRAEKGR